MLAQSRRRLSAGAAATLLVGCVSCDKGPTTPERPSSPVAFVSLRLVAPREIAPGESMQLIANAVKGDGSVENVTSQTQLTVQSAPAGSTVLALNETGLATGRDRGRGTVTARFRELSADATIIVLPRGTFHLAGRITENSVGLADVDVAVVQGIGEGLAGRTNAAGDYELYGVSGSVMIRASRAGYQDRLHWADVTSHGSLTIELTRAPSGGPPNGPADYTGVYRLTVTATECTSGFPEAAKVRVYTARVDQAGADLRLTLTGADFLPGSGSIRGSIAPTGVIHFVIRPLSVWDYDGPDMHERLGDGTVLATMGPITAVGTPAGISGRAYEQQFGLGGIFHLPPRGSSWSLSQATATCLIDRFEMVPRS
jgi:hypothetical protein